ncbi:FemAB family PEP-CTERM system-associated protein [bacterium]|nr:FemAB family PEP-CTERM system-associated protein [bacterium]
MKVLRLNEEQENRWDDYVKNTPQATFFHLVGWKHTVERTFGHRAYYLYIMDGGSIRGILPLFLVRTPLIGRALISIPYAVYGGACADDEKTTHILLKEAKDLAEDLGVSHLELRHLYANDFSLPTKDLYTTFIKELPRDPQDCLKSLPRKARAAARSGLAHGLVAEMGLSQMSTFYKLHAINVRRLGSPVMPFKWFENLLAEFAPHVNVLSVRYKKKIVAAVLTFFFRDTVMPYHSGSLKEYAQYQINNVMYLRLMEYGSERGYRYFDFGRSRHNTGSYHFKKHQGFKPRPLHYQYYLRHGKELPDLNPSNPTFSIPQRIWPRLPLWATQLLGPRVIKYIP